MQSRLRSQRIQQSRIYELTILGLVGGLLLGSAYSNLQIPENDKTNLLEMCASFQKIPIIFEGCFFRMISKFFCTMIQVDEFAPAPISFAVIGGLFSCGYATTKNLYENCCHSIRQNKTK